MSELKKYGLETIKDAVDKMVSIAIDKHMVLLSEQLEIKDDFVFLRCNNKNYTIHKSAIKVISFVEETKTYKIFLIMPTTTKGILRKIEGKFITLEIEHIKAKTIYHDLIPISNIKGIKVYNPEIENYEVEDLEDE